MHVEVAELRPLRQTAILVSQSRAGSNPALNAKTAQLVWQQDASHLSLEHEHNSCIGVAAEMSQSVPTGG
jgi:hypothetical protein